MPFVVSFIRVIIMGNLEKWSDPSTRFLFPFCELLTVKKFLFFVVVSSIILFPTEMSELKSPFPIVVTIKLSENNNNK